MKFRESRSKLLRLAVALGVVAVLVGVAFLLVQRKQDELRRAPEYGQRPRPVTVAKASEGEFSKELEYLAVVESAQRADVIARVSAEVRDVLVDEGTAVQAGEVLARLDPREPRQRLDGLGAQIDETRAELAANAARIDGLKASANYWRREAQRFITLGEQGAVPASESEQALQKAAEVEGQLEATRQQTRVLENRIERLRHEKAAQQTRLSYYTIESPWAGTVTRRHVDGGDMARPDKLLFEIEPTARLKLVFDVPQTDLPAVQQGLPVRYRVDGRWRRQPLGLLYPTMNTARMKRAEVTLPDAPDAWTSGSYVPVSVVVQSYAEATLVPRSALIADPRGKTHVFVVDGDRLRAREVIVLGHEGDRAAVRGLEPGREVALHTYLGWAQMTSNEKVKAIR